MPRPAPAHKSFADRNSLYQGITDKIIAELEQGRLPWVQPWGGVTAPLGLPRNAATGRAYTGINVLILWCAVAERGFSGQSWLTFRQALKIGAHVRKGEKGTTIVYADRFVPYRERTRAAETGDEPDAIPFLKRFTVFNADQCADLPADIAPPPAPAERERTPNGEDWWEGACLLWSARWREPDVNVRLPHDVSAVRNVRSWPCLGNWRNGRIRQRRAHLLWKHRAEFYELDRRPMLAAASTMTSYTRWGWDSIGTWLDATSVTFAFIRAARKRCSSG